MVFLVPCYECLMLLAAEQLDVLVLRSLDMKFFSFFNVSIPVKGITPILNLPTVCMKMMLQIQWKCQTHQPSTLHVKMRNLLEINVYNFRYKISVGILMKLFFLSYKCISKWVRRLMHRQIIILRQVLIYNIHALSCAHFCNCKQLSGWGVKKQFLMIFDLLGNNIFLCSSLKWGIYKNSVTIKCYISLLGNFNSNTSRLCSE